MIKKSDTKISLTAENDGYSYTATDKAGRIVFGWTRGTKAEARAEARSHLLTSAPGVLPDAQAPKLLMDRFRI